MSHQALPLSSAPSYWAPWYPSDMPNTFLPQGFHTTGVLCQECPCLRYPNVSLALSIQNVCSSITLAKALFQIAPWHHCHHCYSFTKSCPTHFNPMDCIMPGFPVLHCLPEFAQTHVHWVSDAIQPSHSLSLLSPPALNPSSIRVFSSEWALCIWGPKYWSFSFSISPSNEYSGWISLRIDWFDLLAVQGTLQNLLQHHYLKASMLWCSACFMVQHSTCQDSILLYSSQYHVLSADPCVCHVSFYPS